MHKVLFKNTDCGYNEALPMGNGVFGGMVYFEDNSYKINLNHYEVYYSFYERYSKQYEDSLSNGTFSFFNPQNTHADYIKRAQTYTGDYTKQSYQHYRKTIWPEADLLTDAPYQYGVSHPGTGEINLLLSEKYINSKNYELSLDINNATISFISETESDYVKLDAIILSDCDAVYTNISQSASGNIKSIKLQYPMRRNYDHYKVEFTCVDETLFYCSVSFYKQGKDAQKADPFKFITALKLINAKAHAEIDKNGIQLNIYDDDCNYSLVSYVLTELTSNSLEMDVYHKINNTAENISHNILSHSAYWKKFFSKSSIDIPDKFLERLWYLNLYLLGCCNGKNGKRSEQSWGLNGLWDICQPTMWGSLWYWDINIQSSYWPLYTANHLELAGTFNEGLLSYCDMAKKYAQEFYGVSGIAIDYPHEFYNCIWPWSTQFLWWYYEFTLDEKFLREELYPLIKDEFAFIQKIANYDKGTDRYSFFPDISPEQGPITKNSTITLATVKYLLKIAIKANEILSESKKDKACFTKFLEKLSPYSTAQVDKYGLILKDSELAPDKIWLRHPSLLMPIYPISEFNPYEDSEQYQLALNTVNYVIDNTEIGVFQFGWMASAAARLHKGNMAYRLLYEKGLDCILRANGLGAEETDRWVNHCLVYSPQLYSPFMMECAGEIVASVNEMLLQNYDGIITVFPAIPDGDNEDYRFASTQAPLTEKIPCRQPERWENCSFEKLLSKGGFEVSSAIANGIVSYIKIHSLYGKTAYVRLPDNFNSCTLYQDSKKLPFTCLDGIMRFDTEPGKEYTISPNGSNPALRTEASGADDVPFHYISHFGRHVFTGKDQNSDTIKLIDSFLFDKYIANDRYRNRIPYYFNFGNNNPGSTSTQFEYQAAHSIEKSFISIPGDMIYTTKFGYGFNDIYDFATAQCDISHPLLRDCILGNEPSSFSVELPDGIYEILVVCGCESNTTSTEISCDGMSVDIHTTPKVYRRKTLYTSHKNNGMVTLQFKPLSSNPTGLNLMVIKKLHSIL